MIDRANLGAVLNEQGLSRTGIVAKDSTVQMGRIIGTNYMPDRDNFRCASSKPREKIKEGT